MKLRVLQWNVWFREDAKHIVQFLQQVGADVLCLQELTVHSEANPHVHLPQAIQELGYQGFYQPTINQPHEVMGNSIFSKLPIASTRHVYVQHKDPAIDDYSRENRIYIEVCLNTPAGILTVGTVHLSYTHAFSFSPEKEAETQRFIAAIVQHKKRFVVTGDLNALPQSRTIEALEQKFQPAGPPYEEATWTTKPFSYQGFTATGLQWRLDYAFTSDDLHVASSKVLHTDVSDHLPLLIELEL